MKLTRLLRQSLLEKTGDTYEYGCVMLHFHFPQMKEIHDQIDPEDLYTEEGDRSYGLEDESHITLLFGLHPDVSLEDVVEVLDQHTYTPCFIHNASLFQNESYDVLKFDVRGDGLVETNKELREFPHTNKFPDYHPHMTIGYVKPGKGKKYTDLFEGKEYKLIPRFAEYSQPWDDVKDKIAIKVKSK